MNEHCSCARLQTRAFNQKYINLLICHVANIDRLILSQQAQFMNKFKASTIRIVRMELIAQPLF